MYHSSMHIARPFSPFLLLVYLYGFRILLFHVSSFFSDYSMKPTFLLSPNQKNMKFSRCKTYRSSALWRTEIWLFHNPSVIFLRIIFLILSILINQFYNSFYKYLMYFLNDIFTFLFRFKNQDWEWISILDDDTRRGWS